MKQITLDFETYKEELNYENECGKNEGISLVMKWLESEQPLIDFLISKGYDRDEIYKWLESDNWHWARIAKKLGKDPLKA